MQLLPLRKNSATWDSIGYHVSDDARRLLLHGSLHSLAQGAEVRGISTPAGCLFLHTHADCFRQVESPRYAGSRRRTGHMKVDWRHSILPL